MHLLRSGWGGVIMGGLLHNVVVCLLVRLPFPRAGPGDMGRQLYTVLVMVVSIMALYTG